MVGDVLRSDVERLKRQRDEHRGRHELERLARLEHLLEQRVIVRSLLHGEGELVAPALRRRLAIDSSGAAEVDGLHAVQIVSKRSVVTEHTTQGQPESDSYATRKTSLE